jgi:regulator of replication initiation timing
MTLINYILNSSAFRQFFYHHFANIFTDERAKREKEGIKGKLKSVTEEIKELKIENDDLKLQQTENRSVSTLSNRRYNDDIRTCVMEALFSFRL